ncbi:ERI1 exoribonuclease 3 isoform X6 [Mauremys reevesii]|uniref:ERI1 exoribonuclease 3 isoform X6 n=1 Tax=Mauremys reevesii TaxID=260615 RepID=UPI00193F0339|nr:ERI1 exoribonuclease 3 isoform X6 [Mauremys reevesii]
MSVSPVLPLSSQGDVQFHGEVSHSKLIKGTISSHIWTRCRPERASSGREAQGKALNSLRAEPKLTKCPGDEKRRRAWDYLREEEKAQDVIHYRGNALPRECFAKSGSQLSGLDRSVVSDASGCSMIALFHTGAAKIPPTLLPRVRQALCSHRLRCFLQGCGSTLNRKLASHGFGASMAAMSSFPPQRYHYFLVLDFEATCDKPQIHPQEIIEFPILKLNGRTMEIESTFHMYVQPVVHPQLTPFCTELTGIIQGMVDGQPNLQQVLERVDEWMAKEGLLDPSVKSIFVTCGDWDLKVMLPGQCQYLGLPVADYFKQWINLKKGRRRCRVQKAGRNGCAYSFAMGSWPKNGLLDMNKGLNLQHIGRPHSGIDKGEDLGVEGSSCYTKFWLGELLPAGSVQPPGDVNDKEIRKRDQCSPN